MSYLEIENVIQQREEFLEAGRAQSEECRSLKLMLIGWLNFHEFEYFSHNLAFLGSKRYQHFLNPNLKRMLKKEEYKKFNDIQILNFEKLKIEEIEEILKK